MNAFRSRAGLRPLRSNGQLHAAAQGMAADLAASHRFAHIASDGRTLVQRVSATGYTARRKAWRLAENIAWGSRLFAPPLSAASGWMDSPAHRDNLLDPGLRDVGIGVAQGTPDGASEPGTFYVADFGAGILRTRAHRSRRR